MSATTKTITGILIGCVIVAQPFVYNPLFGFLFTGLVPGTSIVLPFWAMSLVLGSIGYVAVHWITKDTLYIGDKIYEQKKAKAKARAYVLTQVSRKPSATKYVSSRQTRRRKRGYQVVTS